MVTFSLSLRAKWKEKISGRLNKLLRSEILLTIVLILPKSVNCIDGWVRLLHHDRGCSEYKEPLVSAQEVDRHIAMIERKDEDKK